VAEQQQQRVAEQALRRSALVAEQGPLQSARVAERACGGRHMWHCGRARPRRPAREAEPARCDGPNVRCLRQQHLGPNQSQQGRGGEVEDDPDMWAPHVNGSSEEGKLVQCRGGSHVSEISIC
jgi:hypothetical protein